jgi:hypothetical protein
MDRLVGWWCFLIGVTDKGAIHVAEGDYRGGPTSGHTDGSYRLAPVPALTTRSNPSDPP